MIAPRDPDVDARIAAEHSRHPDCIALSAVAETLDGVSPWLYALAIGTFRHRFGSAQSAWSAERAMGLLRFCENYALSPRQWSDETRAREVAMAERAFSGYHLGWDEGVPGLDP